ncbi:MAG: hypothetical protein WCD55_13250 [Bacteroidales bacterium]
MKKLIFLLALILFAVASCKEKKPASYTRLGYFTPYQSFMEKLNGKVESIVEVGYWGIPEGDSFIKGTKVTKHEFDSIGWTYDYKAFFDIDGDLVSCSVIDENDKVIFRWNMIKENNILARAEYLSNDTVRRFIKITCDEDRKPVLYEVFDAKTDTLLQKMKFEGSDLNDTTIMQSYNIKGEAGGKGLAIYNVQGLLTDAESYSKDGSFFNGLIIKYNDRGFSSETTFLDKDKKVAGTNYFTYEYDEMGNWIRVVCRDIDKGITIISERVYTYFK